MNRYWLAGILFTTGVIKHLSLEPPSEIDNLAGTPILHTQKKCLQLGSDVVA